MAERKRPTGALTETQLEILDLVWSNPSCTVSFLWQELQKKRTLARNTVLTQLTRLEQYGWLSKERDGRSDVYRCTVPRRKAQKERLDGLVSGMFSGSPADLVQALLGGRKIDADELSRVRELVEEAERRLEEER
ncbi:MAG: BlaI/MecI/CopY family transcriptional regulator [Planctomycetota bacterium]